MSVVVRMEMPKGCHDCKLRNMVGNCPIPMFDGQDEEKIWTLEECFQRPPWCPIICQLPEGHGRFADADKLMKDWQTWRSGMYAIASIAMIDQVIIDLLCAVIAPAEAESPSPKPSNPLPIRGVEYVPTKVDVQTGTVTYELRERSET